MHKLSQYENAREKVRKIAFTDSVHSISLEIADAETRTWFEQVGRRKEFGALM